MSEKFDPYHKWLGIPPEEQPPHHYRLLGIGLFEADPDVIEGAADRQMAHVQTHKAGPHSALSQQVLNQLAAAKVCLLNAKKRGEYDTKLRAKQPGASPQAPLPVAVAAMPQALPLAAAVDAPPQVIVSVPDVDGLVVTQRAAGATGGMRARRKSQQLQMAIGVLVVAVLLGVLAVVYFPRDEAPLAAASNGSQPPPSPDTATDHPTPPATPPRQTSVTTDANPPTTTNKPSKPPKPDPAPSDPPTIPVTDNPPRKPPVTPTTPSTPPVTKPAKPVQGDDLAGPKPKLPVPEAEALAAARQEVERAFASELTSARTAAAKVEVATTMFEQGIDPQNDPISRYVLLEQTRDLAATGGDADLALRSVDALAEQFLVDGLRLKLEAALAASKVGRPIEAKQALAESMLALVTEAITAERFDEAGRLADLAKSEAIKAGDPELRQQAEDQDKQVARLAKAQQAVQSAELALEANPDDPEAHLALGKYRCLVLDDWETGLGHLLLSSDADFKSLAEQEQTASEEAESQVEIGDGWWDLAARHAGADKAALQGRARHWYEQALPGLPPLKKKTVEERLGDDAAPVAQAPKKASSLLMQKVKKAISDKRLNRTAAIGQTTGDAFQALPSDGGLLVGLKYTVRGRGNTQTINSMQPIFLTPEGDVEVGQVYGRATGVAYEVRAREGYAIGGITVRGTTRIAGFGVVFIKLGGSSLNKREIYTGDWQGATGTGQDLGVLGKPVVGLHGALGATSGELEAIGLIQTP